MPFIKLCQQRNTPQQAPHQSPIAVLSPHPFFLFLLVGWREGERRRLAALPRCTHMSTNRCPANTGTTNLFLWIGGELYMSVCASVCWFACGHLHAVPLPQLVLMSSPPPRCPIASAPRTRTKSHASLAGESTARSLRAMMSETPRTTRRLSSKCSRSELSRAAPDLTHPLPQKFSPAPPTHPQLALSILASLSSVFSLSTFFSVDFALTACEEEEDQAGDQGLAEPSGWRQHHQPPRYCPRPKGWIVRRGNVCVCQETISPPPPFF